MTTRTLLPSRRGNFDAMVKPDRARSTLYTDPALFDEENRTGFSGGSNF